MARYKVLRDTFLSHAARMLRAGDEVDIDWPKGCEPQKLGDNLAPVKGKRRESDAPLEGDQGGDLT